MDATDEQTAFKDKSKYESQFLTAGKGVFIKKKELVSKYLKATSLIDPKKWLNRS